MKAIFIDLFGKPEGIVIFQLLAATRFTVYLSLISFIGGAFLAAILAYFSIKKKFIPPKNRYGLYMAISIHAP